MKPVHGAESSAPGLGDQVPVPSQGPNSNTLAPVSKRRQRVIKRQTQSAILQSFDTPPPLGTTLAQPQRIPLSAHAPSSNSNTSASASTNRSFKNSTSALTTSSLTTTSFETRSNGITTSTTSASPRSVTSSQFNPSTAATATPIPSYTDTPDTSPCRTSNIKNSIITILASTSSFDTDSSHSIPGEVPPPPRDPGFQAVLDGLTRHNERLLGLIQQGVDHLSEIKQDLWHIKLYLAQAQLPGPPFLAGAATTGQTATEGTGVGDAWTSTSCALPFEPTPNAPSNEDADYLFEGSETETQEAPDVEDESLPPAGRKPKRHRAESSDSDAQAPPPPPEPSQQQPQRPQLSTQNSIPLGTAGVLSAVFGSNAFMALSMVAMFACCLVLAATMMAVVPPKENVGKKEFSLPSPTPINLGVHPNLAQAKSPIIQIFVKPLIGRTFTVEVNPAVTVGSLKIKIQNKVGIPLDQQSLYFAGKWLRDDRTLAEYATENGSTFYLVYRIRGVTRFHTATNRTATAQCALSGGPEGSAWGQCPADGLSKLPTAPPIRTTARLPPDGTPFVQFVVPSAIPEEWLFG
ncbi:hypothetical protein PAPYR_11244 [Paratrimastix pyriformis]|uniref:Ubiquitin-like domain-containing protein n=1 Tax=Paratrimastix pyriformis TaxID=342808 RepID=A0ABQ8U844_9EUKA|nr:hypothetical protein PAPYR_11244 [Paratrimastix pyriformis]